MEFSDALKRGIPLQIRLPNPKRPLETNVRAVAEVFLVETRQGPAVVWLDPFWCDASPKDAFHIVYASPRYDPKLQLWLDNDPRYGPKCLVYQKPFFMERMTPQSPASQELDAWCDWQTDKQERCGREAAWAQVMSVFGDLIVARRL